MSINTKNLKTWKIFAACGPICLPHDAYHLVNDCGCQNGSVLQLLQEPFHMLWWIIHAISEQSSSSSSSQIMGRASHKPGMLALTFLTKRAPGLSIVIARSSIYQCRHPEFCRMLHYYSPALCVTSFQHQSQHMLGKNQIWNPKHPLLSCHTPKSKPEENYKSCLGPG